MLSEIDSQGISVGEVTYPPGGRLGPREQRDVQLVLVHAGSARITIDDGPARTLSAGETGLLLPGHGEAFAFAPDAPTRHSWVQARVGDATPWQGLPATLPTSPALVETVRAAVAAARSPLATRDELVAALTAAALWRYAGEAQSATPADPVERARRFLDDHVADPSVTLDDAARAASVSAPHLVRRFAAAHGITPMAYLWRRRVETGIDLLRHTGLPVGDVAIRSGFRSAYHFSRRVRQHAGVPPTQVRREHWRAVAGN